MAEISALAESDTSVRQIAIGNSTDSVKLLYNSSSTVLRAIVKSSTVNVFDNTFTVNNIGFNKILIKYKQSDFEFWVSGFKVGTQASGSTPSGLSELAFDGGDGGSPFYGKTKQVQYFNSILDSQQLEQLTSWQSFRDMANGQLYTIE